jgi:hypothetical protein
LPKLIGPLIVFEVPLLLIVAELNTLKVAAIASEPVVSVLVEPVPEDDILKVAPLAAVVAPVTEVFIAMEVVLKLKVPALTAKLPNEVVAEVLLSVFVPLTAVYAPLTVNGAAIVNVLPVDETLPAVRVPVLFFVKVEPDAAVIALVTAHETFIFSVCPLSVNALVVNDVAFDTVVGPPAMVVVPPTDTVPDVLMVSVPLVVRVPALRAVAEPVRVQLPLRLSVPVTVSGAFKVRIRALLVRLPVLNNEVVDTVISALLIDVAPLTVTGPAALRVKPFVVVSAPRLIAAVPELLVSTLAFETVKVPVTVIGAFTVTVFPFPVFMDAVWNKLVFDMVMLPLFTEVRPLIVTGAFGLRVKVPFVVKLPPFIFAEFVVPVIIEPLFTLIAPETVKGELSVNV